MTKIVLAVLFVGTPQVLAIVLGPPWQGSAPSLLLAFFGGIIGGSLGFMGFVEWRDARIERRQRAFWDSL